MLILLKLYDKSNDLCPSIILYLYFYRVILFSPLKSSLIFYYYSYFVIYPQQQPKTPFNKYQLIILLLKVITQGAIRLKQNEILDHHFQLTNNLSSLEEFPIILIPTFNKEVSFLNRQNSLSLLLQVNHVLSIYILRIVLRPFPTKHFVFSNLHIKDDLLLYINPIYFSLK